MSKPSKINDLTWMVGGPQGSGVDSSARIFARACALGGLWIYGTREYYSNIKGLHSYFEIRVNSERINSKADSVDLLATFDAETLIRHAESVVSGGGIIYHSTLAETEINKVDTIEKPIAAQIEDRLSKQGLTPDVKGLLKEAEGKGVRLYEVPYDKLIQETGQKLGINQMTKLQRILNVLAVATSLSVLGFDRQLLDEAITEIFSEKKNVVEMNTTGAAIAYDYMNSKFPALFSHKLLQVESQPRLLLMGNDAVAMGKIAGGCRMQTYYPITPASDESEFLEAHENFEITGGVSDKQGSILVVQTEDEIAAITMATGAALSGTRAATSTSGPGFSLMVEGLGWAGMNEVPVVITLYSRGGPATGLPTRHEQGDLKFVLSASHGEFPRIVLCSGDVEEAFYDAVRAFNYAESYQLPVILLVDKSLANTTVTVPLFDGSLIPLQRGKLISPDSQMQTGGEEYKRFALTEDGISPRAVLGMKGYTFWNTGDEHNELGHISEDPENRVRMMTKRMKKLEIAAAEIPEAEKVNFYHASKPQADVTIVSWGSTKGAILEAIQRLKKDGIDAEFLQLRLASPFPVDSVKDRLSKAKLVIDVEQNYSGQMADIIAEKTYLEIRHRVVKFNGRPMSCDEVYAAIRQIISKPLENGRVVLTHGA